MAHMIFLVFELVFLMHKAVSFEQPFLAICLKKLILSI
jgi:hypothetical protein